MASQVPNHLPCEQEDELDRLSNLLHLLFHRNKNQHRRSAWWRWFATFRRQIDGYRSDARAARVTTRGLLCMSTARAAESRQARFQQKVADRLGLWRGVYVERWFVAFGQLIADNQFAAMGLVLLASLARVCQIFDITRSYLDLERETIQELAGYVKADALLGNAGPIDTASEDEDIGEAVSRAGEDVSGAQDDSPSSPPGQERVRGSGPDEDENQSHDGPNEEKVQLDTATRSEMVEDKTREPRKTASRSKANGVSKELATKKSATKKLLTKKTATKKSATKKPATKKRKKADPIDELFDGL